VANTEPDPKTDPQPASRSVVPTFDEFINSEQVAIAVGLVGRVMNEMQERTERMSRRWLHAWNIPAGSDLTRIAEHLEEMERQVQRLSEKLDEKERENKELRARVRAAEGGESKGPSPAKRAAKARPATS
jgi:hypothetical protein